MIGSQWQKTDKIVRLEILGTRKETLQVFVNLVAEKGVIVYTKSTKAMSVSTGEALASRKR